MPSGRAHAAVVPLGTSTEATPMPCAAPECAGGRHHRFTQAYQQSYPAHHPIHLQKGRAPDFFNPKATFRKTRPYETCEQRPGAARPDRPDDRVYSSYRYPLFLPQWPGKDRLRQSGTLQLHRQHQRPHGLPYPAGSLPQRSTARRRNPRRGHQRQHRHFGRRPRAAARAPGDDLHA